MEAVLLVTHLIVALGIIGVVLIQPSEAGGFLGNSGTMSNLMAPRRKADFMTRLTTILAITFFGTSLMLAILAEHRGAQKSILDVVPAATTEAATEAPAAVPVKKEEMPPVKKEEPSVPLSQ